MKDFDVQTANAHYTNECKNGLLHFSGRRQGRLRGTAYAASCQRAITCVRSWVHWYYSRSRTSRSALLKKCRVALSRASASVSTMFRISLSRWNLRIPSVAISHPRTEPRHDGTIGSEPDKILLRWYPDGTRKRERPSDSSLSS